jgi:hypothetical protein
LQDPEAAALLLQRGGMEKLLAVMEKVSALDRGNKYDIDTFFVLFQNF